MEMLFLGRQSEESAQINLSDPLIQCYFYRRSCVYIISFDAESVAFLSKKGKKIAFDAIAVFAAVSQNGRKNASSFISTWEKEPGGDFM